MSNRLGLTSPSNLTPAQKPIHDAIHAYVGTHYDRHPLTSLPDRTLIGPFGIILHHPALASAFMDLAKALRTIPGLSAYGREVVIAVVGARSQAAFENYAHHIIGQRAGLSEDELREIHGGRCPETLTEEGKVCFEVATELGKPGVLDGKVWERAVEVLGREGASAAVFYKGFYEFVGTVLNGFDARLPPGVEGDGEGVKL